MEGKTLELEPIEILGITFSNMHHVMWVAFTFALFVTSCIRMKTRGTPTLRQWYLHHWCICGSAHVAMAIMAVIFTAGGRYDFVVFSPVCIGFNLAVAGVYFTLWIGHAMIRQMSRSTRMRQRRR